MFGSEKILKSMAVMVVAGALLLTGCAGGPLTTREKGAGVGALGGGADVCATRAARKSPRMRTMTRTFSSCEAPRILA